MACHHKTTCHQFSQPNHDSASLILGVMKTFHTFMTSNNELRHETRAVSFGLFHKIVSTWKASKIVSTILHLFTRVNICHSITRLYVQMFISHLA